ncbi:hypothetical protein ACAG39_10360 [Caldicellulosiruptoraceae bacterium PP1]
MIKKNKIILLLIVIFFITLVIIALINILPFNNNFNKNQIALNVSYKDKNQRYIKDVFFDYNVYKRDESNFDINVTKNKQRITFKCEIDSNSKIIIFLLNTNNNILYTWRFQNILDTYKDLNITPGIYKLRIVYYPGHGKGKIAILEE